MNKMLEEKLMNLLKEEAKQILESNENNQERLSKMNDIYKMEKIISNFDDLEETLQKYFEEKSYKEKWGIDDER